MMPSPAVFFAAVVAVISPAGARDSLAHRLQAQGRGLRGLREEATLASRLAAEARLGGPIGPGPGWGSPPGSPVKYPSGWNQIPREPPHGYTEYGTPEQDGVDDHPGTSFDTRPAACSACISFYPEQRDGEKFHDPVYRDPKGGKWEQRCRVGPCNQRDPQVQPWGGMIGAGSESYTDMTLTSWGSWWRAPLGKSCFTQDPVSWFEDCEGVLLEDAKSMYDLTRICSYRHQIAIPPPQNKGLRPLGFAGATEAFTRLDSSREKCLATIQSQGTALFDNSSFCDSDIRALSGCCESVFDSFKCLINEGRESKLAAKDMAGLNATKLAMEPALQLFSDFCIPLCQYSKEEFCDHYPDSDICVQYLDCKPCTAHHGFWAIDRKECTCTQDQFALTTCPKASGGPITVTTTTRRPSSTTGLPMPDIDVPSCKYLEMKDVWSQNDEH